MPRSPEIIDRIEDLLPRFRGDISAIEIGNWLDQFDQLDHLNALELLSGVSYRNTDDLIENYQILLVSLMNQIPEKETLHIFLPGYYGKSSHSMAYYLRKTAPLHPAWQKLKAKKIKIVGNRKELIEIIKKNLQQNPQKTTFLCFLDDFIGTGQQMEEKVLQPINKELKSDGFPIIIHGSAEYRVFLLAQFAMKKGKRLLSKYIDTDKIFADDLYRAFQSRDSVFGNRKKVSAIRELCFRYGTAISPPKKQRTSFHPLGYHNSQALLAFTHTTPNNTVPILWSPNRIRDSKEIFWQPVFPRFGAQRIDRAKKMKKEARFWLATAKRLNLLEFSQRKGAKSSLIDLRLMILLKLLRQKRKIPVICQVLNLSEANVLEILKEGISRGILDSDFKLTLNGHELYNQILKEIIKLRQARRLAEQRSEVVHYIPKKFRGNP